MRTYLAGILMIILASSAIAQNDGTIDKDVFDKAKVNRLDKQGQKHGYWTRKYENGKTAYEVFFNHGKPVGEHRRYIETGQLYASVLFDNTGYAKAKLYDENGKLNAEGFYQNQKRDSVWTFYNEKGILLSKERYRNGEKNGVAYKFYPDGTPIEERKWVNGEENGMWKQYFEDGKPRLEARVSGGKLNGYYLQYHRGGGLYVKGQYKDDLKTGIWVYNGTKGKREVEFVDGAPKNKAVLDSLEQEEFKMLEKNAPLIRDNLKNELNNSLDKWGINADQIIK